MHRLETIGNNGRPRNASALLLLAVAGLSACGGLVALPSESDAGGPGAGASTSTGVTSGSYAGQDTGGNSTSGTGAGTSTSATATGVRTATGATATGVRTGTATGAVGATGSVSSTGVRTRTISETGPIGPDTGTASGITTTGDASVDAAPRDANVSEVADATSPTLCSVLDGFYGNLDHREVNDWPSEIVNGPATGLLADGGSDTNYGPYSIGVTQAECAPRSVMYSISDYNAYTNEMVAYELRVFGCNDGAPYNAALGGYDFAIVPSNYTGQLSTADLDALVAFYVQQAQLILQNHGNGVLTPAQQDEMTSLLQATESSYPVRVASDMPTVPACRDFDGGLQ